jgi:hypothetical protein
MRFLGFVNNAVESLYEITDLGVKYLSGLSQPDVPLVANEELHADFLLDGHNGFAEMRLGKIELLGRFCII